MLFDTKFTGLSVQIVVYFEGIDCSLELLDFVNYLKKVHIANTIIEKQKIVHIVILWWLSDGNMFL